MTCRPSALVFVLLLSLAKVANAFVLPTARLGVGVVRPCCPGGGVLVAYSSANGDDQIEEERFEGAVDHDAVFSPAPALENNAGSNQEEIMPALVVQPTSMISELVQEQDTGSSSQRLDVLQEISKWVTAVNRPKKLRVSGHSALGSIATLSFFVAVMPHLSLGYHANGIPQVYDMSSFDDPVLAKSVGFMFALTAMAGLTRIPRSSSKLRRIMFETSACMTLLLYSFQDSNLGMVHGGWSLDLLMDGPGWIFTWVVYACTILKSLQFLEESIAGPEKGRDTLPFSGSRIGMATIASSMILLLFLNGPIVPACFFDHNREAFEAFCLPGLNYFGGWHTSGYFVVEAYIGFGMLISTLLFEKKINQTQAGVLMAGSFVFSGLYDAAQFFVQIGSAALPVSIQTLIDYGQGVMEKFSLYEIGICLWTFAFIKTMLRVQEEREQAAKLLRGVEQGEQNSSE